MLFFIRESAKSGAGFLFNIHTVVQVLHLDVEL